MPGIASDRSPGIQVGPITQVGAGNAPTPAIGNLMEAFREGAITVDDLVRRQRQNVSESDQLKTQLQAGDITRRLAPGAAQNALAAQGLQAAQIQAAGQVLPGATQLTLSGQELAQQEADRQAALTSNDSKRHAEAVEDATKRQYVDIFGSEPPKSISIPALNPEPVDDFNTWLQKTHGADLEKKINEFDPGVPDPKDHEQIILDQINTFQSGFPLNSKNDNIARAKYANALEINIKSAPTPDQLRAEFANKTEAALREDPSVRTEYEQYRITQGKQTDTLKPGSPEYAVVLRQRIQDAQDKAALRAAKIKAVPDLLGIQAKAVAEAPGKERQAAAVLQKDYATRQEIQDLRKVQAAFYKLERLLDPSVPPSAPRDQGAIFSWMKILDPGSTVREGEYATAANARGVPDKITAWYNKVLTGQILTPDQRTAFKEAVEPVYLGQVQAAAPTIKQFLAQEGNAIGEVVPPEDAALLKQVVPGASATPAAPAKPSPTGTRRVVPTSGPYSGKTLEWTGSGWTVVQ